MKELKNVYYITFEEAKRLYENNKKIGVKFIDTMNYNMVHTQVYKKGGFHDMAQISWYLICDGKWYIEIN